MCDEPLYLLPKQTAAYSTAVADQPRRLASVTPPAVDLLELVQRLAALQQQQQHNTHKLATRHQTPTPSNSTQPTPATQAPPAPPNCRSISGNNNQYASHYERQHNTGHRVDDDDDNAAADDTVNGLRQLLPVIARTRRDGRNGRLDDRSGHAVVCPSPAAAAAAAPAAARGYCSNNDDESDDCAPSGVVMGSNVSRHSGKGLSGRRTQSSGDLCSDSPTSGNDAAAQHQQQPLHTRGNPNGASFCATKHKRRTQAPAPVPPQAPTTHNGITTLTIPNAVAAAAALAGKGPAGASVPTPNASGSRTATTSAATASSTTAACADKAAIYGHINVADEEDERRSTAGGACATDDHVRTKKLAAPAAPCVSRRDRNKFCGSLPNHLDTEDDDDACVDDSDAVDAGDSGGACATAAANGAQQQQHPQHPQHPHQQLIQLQFHQPQDGDGVDYGPYVRHHQHMINNNTISDNNNSSSICNNNNNHSQNSTSGSDKGSSTSSSSNLGSTFRSQPDCCFTVQIAKDASGLGLSVSGGSDSTGPYPGLIRIKRLFPHQVAWSTGLLQPGDILLAANNTPLTGLTNYQALEVLRTAADVVTLSVCRPLDEQYRKLSPPAEAAPAPPQRNQPSTLPLYPIQMNFCGEFEIIMVKEQGSLGFTLRKEDESVLGHCVRALVRQPATKDGRIQPGDKIVAVNDVEMCQLTHEQAVVFLRMAGDTVKLRLYRDEIQTPVLAGGVSGGGGAIGKTKTSLRPEAITLLSDLAFRNRKVQHLSEAELSGSSMRSTNTSPRRLKRNGCGGGGGGGGAHKSSASGNASSSTATSATTTTTASSTSDEGDKTDNSANSFTYPRYIVTSQPTTSVGSDSEASSSISQCSFVVQPADAASVSASAVTAAGAPPSSLSMMLPSISDADYYEEDELWRVDDDEDGEDDADGAIGTSSSYRRPVQSSAGSLAGKSGSTPVSSRKPRFQFTVAANAYELNNLDNEALDAPIFANSPLPFAGVGAAVAAGASTADFISLPCDAFAASAVASSEDGAMAARRSDAPAQSCMPNTSPSVSSTASLLLSSSSSFAHRQPMYQSAFAKAPTGAVDTVDGGRGAAHMAHILA